MTSTKVKTAIAEPTGVVRQVTYTLPSFGRDREQPGAFVASGGKGAW